jgi:hypothetical protein
MEPQDREVFAEAMLVLAEAVERKIPDGDLELHWSILQRYPWPMVEKGLRQAMCRRWFEFPKPCELAELIEAALAQAAERRWLQLQEAVREVGPHHSINCEDRAFAEAIRVLFADWPSACQRLRQAEGAERTMLRKDFLLAYRLAWERSPSSTQGYLKGLREIWQERGINEEVLPVMQIGEADRPQALAILGGSPVQANSSGAVEEPSEPILIEQAKELLDALVAHLSLPATLPRRSRRRLPPAMPEEETPERCQAAQRRRDEQCRRARDVGQLE